MMTTRTEFILAAQPAISGEFTVKIRTTIIGLVFMILASATWADEHEASLYERLGGAEGIETIADGLLSRHLENPTVAKYFKHLDLAWLRGSVIAFLAGGTGGPANYTGADMVTAHAHLKLTDEEFDSAVADVLASVKASGADQVAFDEVQAILLSFRSQVVSQTSQQEDTTAQTPQS